MDERLKFIARLLDGDKMAELCREFGVSRKTGYKICLRMSRTCSAVAGAPRSMMAPQCARRSSGVISVRSRLRQAGRSSRAKIVRRIARVLSAMGAAVSHFSPNSPKLFASRSRRFARCFSKAGERPSVVAGGRRLFIPMAEIAKLFA